MRLTHLNKKWYPNRPLLYSQVHVALQYKIKSDRSELNYLLVLFLYLFYLVLKQLYHEKSLWLKVVDDEKNANIL